MKPGRIVLVVVGSLLALAGLGVILAGAGVAWAYGTQRDDAGYFTTKTLRLDTPTFALQSTKLDLGGDPGPGNRLLDEHDLASVRVTATPTSEREGAVFVGIARQRDVDDYLSGVAHDEVRDVDLPERKVTYRRSAGSAVPAAPTTQPIWAAQTSGRGTQTLDWDVRSGEWSVVVMNADGSAGVDVAATAGVKLGFLPGLMAGLLGGGVLLFAVGVVMIVLGAAGGRSTVPEPQPTVPDLGPASPVRIEGRLDEPLNRWLWLVKWLLALPHFVILGFLSLAFAFATIVAGIVILFSGRYPRRLFTFNVGVMRWAWRVTYYATSAIGTDRYPPFALAERDYPATLDIAYPEHLARWPVLVKWWLLAIPHYLIIGFFTGGAWWVGRRTGPGWIPGYGGGLIAVLVVVAGVGLLFGGSYPRGIFDFVMGLNRWVYRVVAYAALMTDRYPPFRLDNGGTEPGAPPTPPPTLTPTPPETTAEPAPAPWDPR